MVRRQQLRSAVSAAGLTIAPQLRFKAPKVIERMEPQRNPAIVLIAAMPGELKPLIRSWAALATVNGVAGYQHPSATIFAFHAGMGAGPATRAFARAQQVCEPTSIYSVGWVGALSEKLLAGNVLRPDLVCDLATGESYPCAPTEYVTHGTLLTSRRVAQRQDKLHMAEGYPAARSVDMEAATLARLAMAHNLPFRAVKAVSDTLHEDLPDLNPFVTADGQFALARFVAHVAIRPRYWGPLSDFGKHASLAARHLCDSLAGELGVEKPR